MHAALIIIGALFGLMVAGLPRGESSAVFGLLIGGFVGYGLTELQALRARAKALERELEAQRVLLGRLQRELAGAGEEVRGPTRGGAAVSPGSPEASKPPESTAVAAMASPPSGLTGHAVGAAQAPPTTAPASARAESGVSRILREYFTGGNTLVRVGVLILFFGVAFLLRYVAEHSHVPIQLRLGAVAVGGFALLVLGWRLRAKRAGYALALQGGGIGILYLTSFAALRLYAVLSPAAGFAILLVLAVSSAALAVLQDSQAFALLGITGGFLAPILASTGEGSHVVLFSYYTVLNASILAIAWYKSWQPLNLAGFAFTFLISTAWGALHYRSELFASTQPFLALFLAFYIAIAILFSMRQPPNLRGYVDGTLVFGAPMAAFGYQTALLRGRPGALALSAAVLGGVYFMLAWLLHRRQRGSQRLLIDAFIALGVVFVTVATPLALNATATGVTWALEGAALAWIGARQNRVVPRVFGPLLQTGVALLQLLDADLFFEGTYPPLGVYLARAVTAIAAVLTALVLSKYRDRLRSFEVLSAPVMFFIGLAEWLFCNLLEIYRRVPQGYDASAALAFVALCALVCSELSRRTSLVLARLPALWLLPAMLIFAALELVPPVRHPFDCAGWAAWALAFMLFYVVCRRHEGSPGERLANYLHVTSAWLLLALLSWQLAWLIDRGVAGRGSWPAVGWMLIPTIALFWLPRQVERFSWPLRAHREAYMVYAGSGIALYLGLWSLVTNLSLPGDPYPFPYLPLLSALDLAQVLVLGVLTSYYLRLKSAQYSVQLSPEGFPPALTALAFVWLNAGLIRTLHRWAGVPLELDAVLGSTLVQTSLSIFWTLLALATMLVATRRGGRTVWITGACLLAVTIIKLFVIDLSRVGTVERIVSFVGVGLLTLVIGYFSPLPPSAKPHRTV